MSTATLAGYRVTHARTHLPKFGIWWAEASLDTEVTLKGPVTLALADLSLAGTIMSGGAGPKGRARYRVAGGKGNWGRTIPARSYANDAGVKASIVLADAATACGEALDAATLPPTRLGPAYAREEGPAARVLEAIFPGGWYVGEDGVTRIGARPASPFNGQAQVSYVDRAYGSVTLAAEAIAALVPGAIVEGVEAVDVLHELAPGSLRTTLWGAGLASTSRRLEAQRRILEQLDPRARYRGTYEYRVVSQESERLSLQPIRVSTGMPDLQRVFVRPGVPGVRADHGIGSRVLVTFVDCDPARPVVVGFEDAEGAGYLPTTLEILGGVLAAARQTDAVQAGPFVGTITGPCSTKVRIG